MLATNPSKLFFIPNFERVKYVIDHNALEPIMLLDSHIGNDDEEGEGIMASDFTRELLFLDSLCKPRIQIWISSPGGVITEGMQIYSAMLKTKTPIDTYCVGIAASIALPIFAAGRTRYMGPHNKLMTHEASGPKGGALDALEDSVKTMIIQKSNGKLDDEKLSELMKATTWISADDAKNKYGLCDEIENNADFTVTPTIGADMNATNSWKEYKKILNKIIDTKKKPMEDLKKICNKLDLQEESSTTAIIKAIDLRESNYTTELTKVKNSFKDKEEELKNMKASLDDMTDKYNKAKEEMDGMKNKAAEDCKNALGTEADVILAKAAELGKIKNEADVILKWKNKYIADKPGTVSLLEDLGINAKAPDVSDIENSLGEESAEIKKVRVIEKAIGAKYGSAAYMNYVKIQESRKSN